MFVIIEAMFIVIKYKFNKIPFLEKYHNLAFYIFKKKFTKTKTYINKSTLVKIVRDLKGKDNGQ